MKILIIMPRFTRSRGLCYRYDYPLGLGYIASALRQAGHQVDGLNLNHYADLEDTVISRELTAHHYDVVATGATSVFYASVKRIADTVRRNGAGVRIIVGGGLISSEPELMMDDLKPDYEVLGEGESTAVELLACLEKGGAVQDVAGIAYRSADGRFCATQPRKPILDLDALPLPDFDAFEFSKVLDHMRPTDNKYYYPFDHPRAYPLLASRSCPYLCTFCYHPVGNVYRQRSLDSVMHELETNVPRYRINVVLFHDELLSSHQDRVYEFCERFSKFREQLGRDCGWVCQMRVGDVDGDLLKAMKKAGCFLIGYGFESFSEPVLQSMRKKIHPPQIEHAVDLMLANRISLLGNFIFGDTVETQETVRTTLDFWKLKGIAGISLTFIIPFPGTAIYKRCLARGTIKDRLAFLYRLSFMETGLLGVDINCTETMTDDEHLLMKADVFATSWKYGPMAFPRRRHITGPDTCDIVVQCPFCATVMEYRNCQVLKAHESCETHCRHCSYRFFLVTPIGYLLCRVSALLLRLSPRFVRGMLFRRLLASRRMKTVAMKAAAR
ncbi:MAG: radical SAM protein [Kiritimatiellae bacterium]|nr:radical SAM protein [Kiritimatiellia bacterium]